MVDRKDINRLCAKCLRTCRQPAEVVLVDCPRYLPRPFKVAEYRYDQMDLFKPPGRRGGR
jgi:hypothetical protein